MELKHATALVTGASAGIGAAIVATLVAKGCRVIAVARRDERLKALAAKLGPACLPFVLDVTDAAATASLEQRLPEAWRRVDILVNNAGHDLGGKVPFVEGSIDAMVSVVETNVLGLMRLTRALLPGMFARGVGHVVNIGSGAGVAPVAREAPYVASKFAVNGFTQALWLECKGRIRVTQVLPGVVETEFDLVRRHGDAEKAAAFYAGLPVRLAPEDVANAVVYALEQPARVNIAEVRIVPSA